MKRKPKTYKATHGMRVSQKQAIDWKHLTIVQHIELSMPGYELTNNGPKFIYPKKRELANDSK